jgi:hypothetical protein
MTPRVPLTCGAAIATYLGILVSKVIDVGTVAYVALRNRDGTAWRLRSRHEAPDRAAQRRSDTRSD